MDINITDYKKLIYKITNNFPKHYRDDLIQELYIKIYELKNGFDPNKGQFVTYLYKRLFYHCKDYINQNRIVDYNLQELVRDEDYNEVEQGDLIPSDIDEEIRFHYEDYIEKYNQRFTPQELFIRRKYDEGFTVRMIIDLYSPIHEYTSKTSIYNILKK